MVKIKAIDLVIVALVLLWSGVGYGGYTLVKNQRAELDEIQHKTLVKFLEYRVKIQKMKKLQKET